MMRAVKSCTVVSAVVESVLVTLADAVGFEEGELGVLPLASCSFFSLRHSLTSCPGILQWEEYFLDLSSDFWSFPLPFLAALAKNAVSPIQDLRPRPGPSWITFHNTD